MLKKDAKNKVKTILSEEEISRIINSEVADPFSILGMHKISNKELVVRLFNPNVKEAVLTSKSLKQDIKLTKIHEHGLFEEVIPGKEVFEYDFILKYYEGGEYRTKDPYSFLPVLTEYDLHLFNEGNNHRVYEKMGSSVVKHGGVDGVHFAVWAPEAKRVSVVGSFNNWDGRVHQMRTLGASGVWEIFIPGLHEGDIYRFEIKTKNNNIMLKSDPYAYYSEIRPANASVVYNVDKYKWNDSEWMNKRKQTNWLERPMSTYEVHLGSWMRKEENKFLTYEELADKLVTYVAENNFTHVELMPVSEHPLDESWGYQVTGYFAANSRFGKPEGLMDLIDKFHQKNIGVIIDWVPGHFPKDDHSLGKFDGSSLYEHEDPKQGEHMDWGTYIFNYGRNEVKNFLISNALFWMDKYHVDGFRVDAVASMLYLDYSRNEGEWIPNKYGGRENLEAIEFLKYFNSISHHYYPGILTIAEESTAFPGVTVPPYLGGLGFSLKWNMGWMNDSLEYIEKDSIYRKYHQGSLTFSMVYAFSENFQLVLSHDEVVYGKKSMLDKMPGDMWQKFANLRLFYSYMYAHPGKNLIFMGGEFGQWQEWNCNQSLDWHLLENQKNSKMHGYMKTLNKIYGDNKAFWEIDFSADGFEWIDFHDGDNSILSFVRKSKNEDEVMVCVFNFTPNVHDNYRIGVPKPGYYEEILNSDASEFGGSNIGNLGGIQSEKVLSHGREHSISMSIPPLSGVYFKLKK